MPYRTELRRPDLKGVFKCTLCTKIFCHSSSLSRHRMQAHFKSYTCTLCNKEITSNETLRAHMYRKHQISRMFMCRCCNWAFPDKTSLHIHVQAMASSNTPGNVSIIAKSTTLPMMGDDDEYLGEGAGPGSSGGSLGRPTPSPLHNGGGVSPAPGSEGLSMTSPASLFPASLNTPVAKELVAQIRQQQQAIVRAQLMGGGNATVQLEAALKLQQHQQLLQHHLQQQQQLHLEQQRQQRNGSKQSPCGNDFPNNDSMIYGGEAYDCANISDYDDEDGELVVGDGNNNSMSAMHYDEDSEEGAGGHQSNSLGYSNGDHSKNSPSGSLISIKNEQLDGCDDDDNDVDVGVNGDVELDKNENDNQHIPGEECSSPNPGETARTESPSQFDDDGELVESEKETDATRVAHPSIPSTETEASATASTPPPAFSSSAPSSAAAAAAAAAVVSSMLSNGSLAGLSPAGMAGLLGLPASAAGLISSSFASSKIPGFPPPASAPTNSGDFVESLLGGASAQHPIMHSQLQSTHAGVPEPLKAIIRQKLIEGMPTLAIESMLGLRGVMSQSETKSLRNFMYAEKRKVKLAIESGNLNLLIRNGFSPKNPDGSPSPPPCSSSFPGSNDDAPQNSTSGAYVVMPDDAPVMSSALSQLMNSIPTANASPLNSLLYKKKLSSALKFKSERSESGAMNGNSSPQGDSPHYNSILDQLAQSSQAGSTTHQMNGGTPPSPLSSLLSSSKHRFPLSNGSPQLCGGGSRKRDYSAINGGISTSTIMDELLWNANAAVSSNSGNNPLRFGFSGDLGVLNGGLRRTSTSSTGKSPPPSLVLNNMSPASMIHGGLFMHTNGGGPNSRQIIKNEFSPSSGSMNSMTSSNGQASPPESTTSSKFSLLSSTLSSSANGPLSASLSCTSPSTPAAKVNGSTTSFFTKSESISTNSASKNGSTGCEECSVVRGQTAVAENRNQFLSTKVAALNGKISRLDNRIVTLEANASRYENEAKTLRNLCEMMERKMLEVQEKTLNFLESSGGNTECESMRGFLQNILESCQLTSNGC